MLRLVPLCLLLLLPATVLALPRLTAVFPSPVSPGQTLTVLADGIGPGARILLGDQVLAPQFIPPGTLTLSVPALAPGEYLLQILQDGELSTHPLTLRVSEPVPRILSLTPSNIDQCATASERYVSAETQDMLEGATLLLNGAALPFSPGGQGRIRTQVPPLPAGSYGMEIVNPGGARSLPQTLWFNSLPRIESISQGPDFVNYYQLILKGKNFTPSSTLMVHEYPTGFNPLPPMQKIVPPQGASSGNSGQIIQRQSDHLQYIDCTTLIYNRFPYSNQPRQISIQVINPDGQKSEAQTLTTP